MNIALIILLPLSAASQDGDHDASPPPFPAQSAHDLIDMTLEEMLSIPVTVAAKSPQPLRQTPGIVSVIRRDEIERSGARDLLDILHMVPGVGFGMDVGGVVGISIRGNWAHEGKALLLIDGVEMNELSYLTTQYGNHFPASLIERVEVIRGPGSALYGGNAELAVIAVTTRRPSLSGFEFSASGVYGGRQRGLGRQVFSIYGGYKSDDATPVELDIKAVVGEGRRSGRIYRDFDGNQVEMSQDSALNPLVFSAGVRAADFEARFLLDRHQVQGRDGIGGVTPVEALQGFETIAVAAKYDFNVSDVSITPKLSYRRQLPWLERTEGMRALGDDGFFYNKGLSRLSGGLETTWRPVSDLQIQLGGEYVYDDASLIEPIEADVGFNSSFGEWRPGFPITDIAYTNWVAHTQGLYATKWGEVDLRATLGLRFESHSQFGDALVPRAGLTLEWRGLSSKLLFSDAFKSPGVENINTNPDIERENTRVLELELAYQISDAIFVTVNGFDITIKKPIVYVVADDGSEAYQNLEQVGTSGVEAELRIRHPGGYTNATYSYYFTSAGRNRAETYSVPENDAVLLGVAPHKVTLASSFQLFDNIVFSPSIIYLSRRYAITSLDASSTPQYTLEDHAFLANVSLLFRDLGFTGFNASITAYNLANQNFRFVQPYDGGTRPLPALDLEFAVRISYSRNL